VVATTSRAGIRLVAFTPMKAPLRLALLALLCAGAFAQAPAPAAAPAQPPLFRAYGVRINVSDMEAGLAFYTGTLGFAVESREQYPAAVTLKPDERHYTHITLVQQPRTGSTLYRRDTHTSFTLWTADIRAFLVKAAKTRVRMMDNYVRIEQVGLAATYADPWGATFSVMDTTARPETLPPEPRIYNYGLYLPMNAYAKAREFWCDKLGFVTLTDRYLPLDQALFSSDKQWGFMLHMREGAQISKGAYPGYTMPIIQLATPDLDAALAKLKDAGAEILLAAPATDAFGRRYTAFREPFGVPIEVLEIK
jgi:catechol 2,3-dioxygenase-like lactoylglutathione lyase family enzyme